MSEARLADALGRLNSNANLRLPLRSRDLFGRLALRFLWRRQVKWQIETNLAARDALDSVRELMANQRTELGDLAARVSDLASQEELHTELANLRRSDQNMMAGLNQRLYSAIGGLRTELSDLRLRLADKTENVGEITDRLDALAGQLTELTAAARDTRRRAAQVDLFLDLVRDRKSTSDTPSDAFPDTPSGMPPEPLPDRAAYLELAVAELLDGPVELAIGQRRGYLPVVRQARESGATGAAFDVAPGRGEWLDVLRAAEIPARAVTTNPVVLRHCAELGHPVEEAEPLRALADVPARSLGAVTAFRYVERLAPGAAARFVDLASRALMPGGVLVVETPWVAGDSARDFHLDPFAERPVHPTFLRFLAEAAGFGTVRIQYPNGGSVSEWPTEPEPGAGDRYCLLAWL